MMVSLIVAGAAMAQELNIEVSESVLLPRQSWLPDLPVRMPSM